MKVSLNWLKDFVSIRESADSLSHKLTMAGLEVTDSKPVGEDWMLDMEITSNRPDCLSHVGIAREIAAITGRKLNLPKSLNPPRLTRRGKSTPGATKGLSIKIQDKKGCPLYTARIIENVSVRQSDTQVVSRLAVAGLRGVNNIVDITNYVLLETGQPLHAFDLDKILARCLPAGRSRNILKGSSLAVEIIVRRAKPGEKIITIDGIERILTKDILVIADKAGPIAIAGVMGGIDSEVDKGTKRIILESAYFDPITIRHVRQKLGLDTESSYRFERGVNLATVFAAQQRTLELIKAANPKCSFLRLFSAASSEKAKKKASLHLDTAYASRLLGVALSQSHIKSILKRLGFYVSSKGGSGISVSVPDFRKDINIEEDIIEEIARVYGYDNIPVSLPKIRRPAQIKEISALDGTVKIIKGILFSCGISEVISYSLISLAKAKNTSTADDGFVAIVNPLSKEQELLRPNMLCGLLDVASHNFNHAADEVSIFEIGAVFRSLNGRIDESASLGILISGKKINDWYRSASLKDKLAITFFDIKGIMETIFLRLGIDSSDLGFRASPSALYENAMCVDITIKGENIGCLGKLDQAILKQWGIRKKDVFVSLIDLGRLSLFINLKKNFRKFSSFPVAWRDISFIVKEDVSVKSMKQAILNERTEILKEILLFDEYRGSNIPPGLRSLSFSLKFGASDRTLREKEIVQALEKIKSLLEEKFAVRFR